MLGWIVKYEGVPETLLTQSRASRFRGVTGDVEFLRRGRNPLCGDEIQLGLIVEGELVRDLRFDGRGCIVSQGAAAMLCERVSGRRIDEVVGATVGELLGFDPAVLTMNRQRCAGLAYEILQDLLRNLPTAKPPRAANSLDED